MVVGFDITTLFTPAICEMGLNAVELNVLVVSVIILLIFDIIDKKYNLSVYQAVNSQGIIFKWIFNLALICFVAVFGIYGPGRPDAAFLYFQF